MVSHKSKNTLWIVLLGPWGQRSYRVWDSLRTLPKAIVLTEFYLENPQIRVGTTNHIQTETLGKAAPARGLSTTTRLIRTGLGHFLPRDQEPTSHIQGLLLPVGIAFISCFRLSKCSFAPLKCVHHKVPDQPDYCVYPLWGGPSIVVVGGWGRVHRGEWPYVAWTQTPAGHGDWQPLVKPILCCLFFQ